MIRTTRCILKALKLSGKRTVCIKCFAMIKLQKSRSHRRRDIPKGKQGTSEAVTANVYAASILTLQNAYKAQN
jgi:hypothetical protein